MMSSRIFPGILKRDMDLKLLKSVGAPFFKNGLTHGSFQFVGKTVSFIGKTVPSILFVHIYYVVHAVHVCPRKISPGVEGLQRSTLGPCRNFRSNQINGEFIQILHTGDKHWVCVASMGCGDGTVNLYDSLYLGIIYREVEDRVINLG